MQISISNCIKGLIIGGLTDERFIMVVKSDNAGTSGTDQFTIPTTGGGYLYDVETSDGYTATGITGNHTITFPTGAGTHTVYIKGDFPKMYFNNGGDKLKMLEVTQWGSYGVTQADQTSSFRGCENLSQIADGGAWFDVVTIGQNMFFNNALTSLPSGMELPLLTSGLNMFYANSLTSLPSGMELPLLTIGQAMFYANSLTSLPSGMELPLLTNGFLMFSVNSITSLPSGMELPLLTNGNNMFNGNSLTSLPSGMELPLLTIGVLMFQNNFLTSLPSGMKLPLLTNGNLMFNGNTINTTRYSQLLIDLESGNANNSVTFHGGNSQYNPSGETARNILTSAPRNWTITDGGLE